MCSKFFLLLGFLVVAFLITSKVSAGDDLADTSHARNEVKGIKDSKYGGYPGGGEGYQGGGGYPGSGGYQGGGGYPGGGYQGGGGYPGRGGYQGGGGYRGGRYCRYGCCGRQDYRGYCLRCCGVKSQVETKPHN
ncbi:hypothetical protein KSS87_009719 [Heliosperma pusillum]|nr:hypothetical protein KSS87_011500 [Heliosperma pusillum]KAH9615569.1 hypothetical protein KSS87_009719 [Heliosperma pusillum]